MAFSTHVRARTSARHFFPDDEEGTVWDAHSPIESGRGEILTRSELTVHCEVVKPFHVIPRRVLANTCSGVLRGIMKLLLPAFVRMLRDDFGIWATSKVARQAREEKAVRIYGTTGVAST